MKQLIRLLIPVFFLVLTGAAPVPTGNIGAPIPALASSAAPAKTDSHSGLKTIIQKIFKEKDGNWLASVSLILGVIALITALLGGTGFLLFLYLSTAVVTEIVCIPLIGICFSTLSSTYVTSVFFSLLSSILFGGISGVMGVISLIFGITAYGVEDEFTKKRRTASGLGIALSVLAILLLLVAFAFGWLLVL